MCFFLTVGVGNQRQKNLYDLGWDPWSSYTDKQRFGSGSCRKIFWRKCHKRKSCQPENGKLQIFTSYHVRDPDPYFSYAASLDPDPIKIQSLSSPWQPRLRIWSCSPWGPTGRRPPGCSSLQPGATIPQLQLDFELTQEKECISSISKKLPVRRNSTHEAVQTNTFSLNNTTIPETSVAVPVSSTRIRKLRITGKRIPDPNLGSDRIRGQDLVRTLTSWKCFYNRVINFKIKKIRPYLWS